MAGVRWKVIRVADGNDFTQVIKGIEEARDYRDGPAVVICETIKGKGISYMENNPSFHGAAPNAEQLKQGLRELGSRHRMPVQTYGEKATREVFGPTLAKLCEDGLDIVCVDADLGYSTSAVKFGAKFPERFFPVGVAEQNMIGVAAGLAATGKVAFAGSFAVFAPGHCFDQLRMAVAQPRTT